MIILLSFFILSAFSMELSSERYCFASLRDREKVFEKLSMILVPSDKVSPDEACLVVQTSDHRRELIQRYVLMTYPEAKISFSSAEMRQESCKLQIEKIKSGIKNQSMAQASTQDLTLSQSSSSTDQKEIFLIETLREFELRIDQESIQGICQYIKPERYEITLKLKRALKPLVNNAPSSSISTVTTPPVDQETFELVTTLQLQRGEKMNIGEVIQKTKNKNRDLNLNPSLKAKSEDYELKEAAYLSIQ